MHVHFLSAIAICIPSESPVTTRSQARHAGQTIAQAQLGWGLHTGRSRAILYCVQCPRPPAERFRIGNVAANFMNEFAVTLHTQFFGGQNGSAPRI